VKLPGTDITVVHRADGSGTTWIYTNYLCKVSKDWQDKVGNDKSVSWPVGVGGKGNEGVASYVQQIDGAIGYVEFAYAIENKIPYAQLQNKAGKFVMPTIESFQAAAANADWANAPGFYMVLTEQEGEKTWPISGASFILIYKDQTDGSKAKEMLKFFDWCYKHGEEQAKKLNYVPIPKKVFDLVEKDWTNNVKLQDKPLWP
jgi:phosphate transport system substrate-binding protein